ncbi:hypothetical protein KAS50_00725, partial [bacterium]|nr:hypothetical protein [bacterium]
STQVAPYNIKVYVTDDGTPAMVDSQILLINVTNVDNPHNVSYFGPITAKVGKEQSFSMTIFDADAVYNPGYGGFNPEFLYKRETIDTLLYPYPAGMVFKNISGTSWNDVGTSWTTDTGLDFKWTPLKGQSGSVPMNLIVDTRSSGSYVVIASYSISVTGNNPPSVSPISNVAYNAGDNLSPIQVAASDADTNSLVYSLSVSPSTPGLTISSSGLIEYPNMQAGTYTVTVQVSDLSQSLIVPERNNVPIDTTEQVFTIEVTEFVNSPPYYVTFPAADTISAGSNYVKNITAHDNENPMTFTLTTAPTGMTIVGQSSSAGDTSIALSWTPASDQVGDHTVTLKVSDGIEDADSTYTITVLPNQSPYFVSFP